MGRERPPIKPTQCSRLDAFAFSQPTGASLLATYKRICNTTPLSHGVKNMRRRFIVADLRFIK
ncbi:hypothetical protein EKG40_05670 [Pseudomonas moorei]|nr:hypothetical protein EKG40_05670 [Pseudomonas moorei]